MYIKCKGEWETFTDKDKALVAFRAMVQEIEKDYKEVPERFDYVKFYSCYLVDADYDEFDEVENSKEIILLWTFGWRFTKCDAQTETPKDFLLERSEWLDEEGTQIKDGYTHEDYEDYLNGLTLEDLKKEFISYHKVKTIEEAIDAELEGCDDE